MGYLKLQEQWNEAEKRCKKIVSKVPGMHVTFGYELQMILEEEKLNKKENKNEEIDEWMI